MNGKYAIFGTGQAADIAFEFAASSGLNVAAFVDDFAKGFHHGLPIISWEYFLLQQKNFNAIITEKHQKGFLHSRQYISIPILSIYHRPNHKDFSESIIKKLLAFKGVGKGKRCFILGNGPSLKLADIEKLKDEVTFASNKIYLVYPETDWRPTYYFVEDILVAKNNSKEIDGIESHKFLEHNTLEFLDPKNSCVFFYKNNAEPIFSDVMHGIGGGRTVTATQLQFARFMGFEEVYMIGMDFSFTLPENTEQGQETLISSGERNHFHPDYRKAGETWSFPDLATQKQFFDYTAQHICSDDFRVYNASRSSKLDSFPRVDFDSLFKEES